jgi:regulator of protease activity HflC (stomatin/prohibitin superfamily)
MTELRPGRTDMPEGAWAQSVRLGFRFLFAAVLVMALCWMVSGIRQVPPDKRAVVLWLGQVVREQGPGLLLAWPRPIEQVALLPSADSQFSLRIRRFDAGAVLVGRRLGYQLSPDPRRNAGLLLAGNGGVVHLQATVLYRISDPATYLIERDDVAPALERLVAASAVEVAASRSIDAILVASTAEGVGIFPTPERLRFELVTAVNRRLAALAAQGAGLGVTVTRADLVASLPEAARYAFDHILAVTQLAEQSVAQARSYAEKTAQSAAQERQRILATATAAADERQSQAVTSTAPIMALIPQAATPAGKAVISRIYYDRVGALLRGAKQVVGFDPSSGAELVLPGTSP